MTAPASNIDGIMAWLKARASDRVVRNLGWYGLSEMAVRVSRLLATIIIARALAPEDFGLVAIVLTTFELVRALANNGVGLTIVRAAESDLARCCATAFRVACAVAAVMVALQLVAGCAIAWSAGRGDLLAMLAVLAVSYALLPFTEINYCRLLRRQDLRTLAAITAAQVLLDNLLTIAFVLCGWSIWAVVLPKLLTAPIYAWLLRRADPWRPALEVAPLPLRPVLLFALPVLGTELLAALRLNLDKILVGAMLGVQALGVYAFAFNAGLGLSLTFTSALSASLFPHFAEVAHDRAQITQRFDAALRASVPLVMLVILLQALAALVYVPIVFGAKWAFAAPLVALLCASGVTRPLSEAAAQLLRARGDTRTELLVSLASTAALLAVFACALPHGIETAIAVFAAASLATHIALLAFTRWWIARDLVAPLAETPA